MLNVREIIAENVRRLPRLPLLARLGGAQFWQAKAYGIGFCDGALHMTDRIQAEGQVMYALLSAVGKVMHVGHDEGECWESQRIHHYDLEAMGCKVQKCKVVLLTEERS
jgi:hypothetical protein